MARHQVKSCGVVVFRRQPAVEFLLMRHADRWDLPKGHVDPGETDLQCAMRELVEETGITDEDIRLDDGFRFESHYQVHDKRFPDGVADKTLLIYLGWLTHDVEIQLTEHIGFEWFPWSPPHTIQQQTIDPLLSQVATYFDHTLAPGESRETSGEGSATSQPERRASE